ncbi:endothelin-converting enzyme homolog isoform X2 [Mya arenaria]|nr:endothelin-converting enzyme homolog isoform X2 [Mya arenaria]XP_052789869.1 endothelin-converting enzyme homolog isoform X2 [Mya arenaria]
MKPKLGEWQPLDLVDKEAVKPLCSFNSRVAAHDHRYYTLGNNHSSVCDSNNTYSHINSGDDDDDNDSVNSDVVFAQIKDPIGDEQNRVEKRRWQKAKGIFVFAAIAITCLVVVILFQHFSGKCDQTDSPCTSTECVQGAAYILNKMDTSIDPCTDFYTFSCGNWLKTTPFPPSKNKYGAFGMIDDEIKQIMKEILAEGNEGQSSSAIQKAFQYHSLCMDEATIEKQGTTPALQLIKDLGSWTLTSDPASGVFDVATWNIQDALLLSHRRGFSPLFSMSVSTDEYNNSQYKIKFDQSGLTLGDRREYFSNHSNYADLKAAFIQFGVDVVTLLGGETDGLKESIGDIYDFEQRLAQIQMSKESLLDPVKNYHNMTLQTFQSSLMGEWLSLDSYMRGIFDGLDSDVTMETVVIVYTPDYFLKLQDVIKKTSEEVLANYLVWHAVESLMGYLPKPFQDASLKLEKVENGVKELPPRWKRCLTKVTSALGFATGALYVQKHFKSSSKQDVQELFDEVRSAFLSNLDDLAWMDDTTRDYAREKARASGSMLGYPEYITDTKLLDEHYENLTLVEGKFFESRIAIGIHGRQKNLQHYGTVPDKTEWEMYPTEVNGYYSPDFNHIAFPAGILRPPLYNPTSPKSFNFGSFGMICGHELTHGFDNKGRFFDKDGNMRTWWTDKSSQKFKDFSQCYVDFYSNFTVEGTHLNGETTLSENIADNGGMKMAYLAWRAWKDKHGGGDSLDLPGVTYTPDQMFFIGMAQLWCTHYTPEYMQQAILTDVHSIAKFRVVGTMPNSKYFAEAFQCPSGSSMNPEHKCKVW